MEGDIATIAGDLSGGAHAVCLPAARRDAGSGEPPQAAIIEVDIVETVGVLRQERREGRERDEAAIAGDRGALEGGGGIQPRDLDRLHRHPGRQRLHADMDLRRRGSPLLVGHHIRDLLDAEEARRRRVDQAAAFQRRSAVRWRRDALDLELVPLDVDVVREQIDRDRGHRLRHRVVRRHRRRVVDRADLDRDDRRIDAPSPIGDPEREAASPIVPVSVPCWGSESIT